MAADAVRLGFEPKSLRVSGAGVRLLDTWLPARLAIEAGDRILTPLSALPPGAELSEAERGAEGRLLVVEDRPAGAPDARKALGPGANRFLIGRPGPDTRLAELEDDWRSGRILGIVLDAKSLGDGSAVGFWLWAGARQALILIEGDSWEEIASSIESRGTPHAPIIAIDPARSGDPDPSPAEMVKLAGRDREVLVALGRGSSGLPPRAVLDSDSLRFLTERTLLMRLRHSSGRSLAEIGRLPSLS